ncbi:MAG: hypothetical protein JW783_00455 [Bacteroidales bacterium]|jgi:hypothetical protein|nr:hypothetical protein [Bacteroidales bacterium]MBN2748492.1 hypothetical protein [Bacteroidales bacterium]
MTTTTLKEKRQHYHRLLLALGEAKYKDVIVSTRFNVNSTKELSAPQLDALITEAKQRLAKVSPKAAKSEDELQLKRWRNKCLLLLNQRGITATPKDWSPVNKELEKKQYQWILTEEQRSKGLVNHKGLYAFNTVESLVKLFKQLANIRDNEMAKAKEIKNLTLKN